MNIDIVILSWAKDDKLKAVTQHCIDSLLRSETNIKFDIVVVESNPLVNYDAPVRTMHLINETTFNYNRFANTGIELGTNEYVVFCNNDLEFHKGWATEMFKWNFHSMSPISYTSGTQNKFRNQSKPIFGHKIAETLPGWCIAVRRDVWLSIGGLNEDYTFWFSDNVYAEQLKANQLDHFLIPLSRVDHLDGGSTTLKGVEPLLKEDLTFTQAKKYNKKFGTNHFNLGNN